MFSRTCPAAGTYPAAENATPNYLEAPRKRLGIFPYCQSLKSGGHSKLFGQKVLRFRPNYAHNFSTILLFKSDENGFV